MWLGLSLVATVTVIIFGFVYGLSATVFPALFLLFFFVFLFAFAFRASVQAGSNPGLYRMQEPDFWLSSVYDAWLYVTDMESWAVHVSLFSYLVAVFLGSVCGGIVLSMSKTTPSVCWASWFVGIFFSFSIAMVITTTIAVNIDI